MLCIFYQNFKKLKTFHFLFLNVNAKMFKITYVTKILFLLGCAEIEGKSARDQEKAFWRGSDLCPMQ